MRTHKNTYQHIVRMNFCTHRSLKYQCKNSAWARAPQWMNEFIMSPSGGDVNVCMYVSRYLCEWVVRLGVWVQAELWVVFVWWSCLFNRWHRQCGFFPPLISCRWHKSIGLLKRSKCLRICVHLCFFLAWRLYFCRRLICRHFMLWMTPLNYLFILLAFFLPWPETLVCRLNKTFRILSSIRLKTIS